MTGYIGTWVARFRHGPEQSTRVTRWHLVESEIAERLVIRCGRQLAPLEGTSLIPTTVAPGTVPPVGDRCVYCERP